MSRLTSGRAPALCRSILGPGFGPGPGAALLLCSVLLQGSCGTQQVATPSRSLDRPSDAALFCVDYELDYDNNKCLPQGGDPERDPAGYLSAWCADVTWRDLTPKVTVLALQECDESHRRVRTESYFAKVRQAARALGRDPDYPCCPGDNIACGTPTPACARRSLSMVIANTARGEMAVANTGATTPGLSTTGRLQNLHGGQPGFGFLPTGLLPEHVRAFSPPEGRLPDGRVTAQGAWAVTTNVGSCDVSVVELQAVAELTRRPDSCDDSGQTCATRNCDAASCPKQWRPWYLDSAGNPAPLRARPSWVEVAPWATPTTRPVIISYPTCGLIAVVDLDKPAAGSGTPPGRISEAIGFDPADPKKAPRRLGPAELANLQCPADCGGDTAPLMPDPNMLPAGGAMRAASYPATLAVDAEGHRLLIGDQVGSALTVVDLDLEAGPGGHLIGTPRQVPLDFDSRNEILRSGRPGIDVIRITPRTQAGRFAYITARDSTVRVVDLDNEVECETNPDPRFLMQNAGGKLRVLPDEFNESNLRRLSCIPVSPATPRRPLAATPGIIMPNGSVPTDIGFLHQDTLPCNNTDPTQCSYWPTAPSTSWLRSDGAVWIGDFGWVLGGGGAILGLQLADSCPQPSYRACFADCGAQRRLALLHTRSQELPSPEQYNLPSLLQSRTVTPQDRLSNVRRNVSRFEDQSNQPAGPYADSDSLGLPVYSTQIAGAFTALYNSVPGANNQTRRQLLYPAPAPYYYLPVDPVCDVAIGPQAVDLSRPDGVLPVEPTRRPVTIAAFTDPLAATSENWSLTWEGLLSTQLSRTSGRLLSTGQLVDVNGLYCSRGVEARDKLWMTGCLSNNDCPLGTLCRLESLQGTAPGVCLSNEAATACRALSQQLMLDTSNDTEWATTWLRRYRITKAQQQVTAVAAGSDLVDALTLDELAEPEFELERKSCDPATLGLKCDHYQAWVLPRHAPTTTPLVSHEAYCRVTGVSGTGQPQTSCILQCATNAECGDGFVCARSPYEKFEAGNPNIKVPGRCVRAPLITADTPTRAGTPLGSAGAAALVAACFPDETRYEIRGGDAFVVSGNLTGTPALQKRASDGTCVKPAPGDLQFAASRLLEPRLRLGPYETLGDLDPGRCPAPQGWISHRVPHAAEASTAPSCQYLLNNGTRKDDGTEIFGCLTPSAGDGGITLPEGNTTPLGVVQADGYLPKEPQSLKEQLGPTGNQPRSYTPGDKPCPPGATDPACQDPWLNREYELFSVLPLTQPTNQCVLTGALEENNITASYNNPSPPNNSFNLNNNFRDDVNYDVNCTGFCRFPGDHTEIGGVRRIHYENAIGNLVMRVPREPAHPTDPDPPKCQTPNNGTCADPPTTTPLVPPRWAVPPEGYSVTFRVYGGLAPYALQAVTAHRDDSSGQVAQSLKVAIPALDGILYLIDEGRGGSASGLRGQVMRVIGSLVDPYFLLR